MSLRELVVVMIIIAVLVLLLLPAVQTARSRGPRGEIVPTEPPDEANRVRNDAGLSIVLPENWEMNAYAEAPRLFIGPPGSRRSSGALLIVQPSGAPSLTDLQGFTAVTFQSSEAYERMVVEREAVFLDDPAWSVYTMYFQHGGQWWHVKYGLTRRCTTLPPMVRQYIDTFRWDGTPLTTRGDQPKTAEQVDLNGD